MSIISAFYTLVGVVFIVLAGGFFFEAPEGEWTVITISLIMGLYCFIRSERIKEENSNE